MTHAWRLTFAYDGDQFTLKSTRKLAKRVAHGEPARTDRAGRFIELRGVNGQVLYRRSIAALIPDSVEFPTGDPARPFDHAPAPGRGEVAILVPALPEGRSVAIVAIPSGPAAKGKQGSAESRVPRDLVTVDLPHEGDAK